MALFDATDRLFDRVEHAWEPEQARQITATGLVTLFLGALVAVELRRRGLLPESLARHVATSHFAAISLAFTTLLLV